jgi:RHS repeat-associated protein
VTNNTKSSGTPGAGFSIGAWSDGSRAFNGDIDEVSVYTANIGTAGAATLYAAGRRADTTTALTTRMNYDRLGRPIDAWAPDSIRSHAVYDRLGDRTETWANYQDGSTSSSTAADDVRSTFAYDVLGELTGSCPAKQVQVGGCDPTSGTNVQAWHYTFDALGRQTKTVPPVNTTATALDTTETVYQAGGRVDKTCTYSAGGSCTSTGARHTDLNLSTSYDALGRILQTKVYDRATGSDVLKFTKTLTWNRDSTPNTVNESSDTLAYLYDPMGRLATFKRGATTLTAYTYNATTGTLASRTDGTVGTTTFGYDWAKRNTAITPPTTFVTGTISRTFRLDGNLASQAFPNGVTETLSYDAAKRPTGIGMGTTGSLSQTYDRAGRVLTEGRSLTGITGDAGGTTQSFTYDGASRVTGSTGLTATHAYTFDLDGNRLTRVDGGTTTTFTYDRTDEIMNQTISGTTKTFAYDAFGNLTTSADAASVLTTSAYDEANRLTSISPAGGTAATFSLDGLGRAKTRTVGANTDTYGYLGASETAYETGAGTTDAIYDASGARVAIKTGGIVSYVIFDLHGSVAALCPSSSTSLSDAYRYDPWGQTIVASGSAVNPWRYRGLLDVSPNSTPLYDMGARAYSPQLGTFTSEDSVAGKAADPLSMNRFLYAEADPTTLIDPDGHYIIDCGDQDFCRSGTSATRTVNFAPRTDVTAARHRREQREDDAEIAYMNRAHHSIHQFHGGPRYSRHASQTSVCSSSICSAGAASAAAYAHQAQIASCQARARCVNRYGGSGSSGDVGAFLGGFLVGALQGAAVVGAIGLVCVASAGLACGIAVGIGIGLTVGGTVSTCADHGCGIEGGPHVGGHRPWSAGEAGQFIGTFAGGVAMGGIVGLAYEGGASRGYAGDLTKAEVQQIQNVVNSAGRPLEVVGSAALGERTVGSDIDYTAPSSSHPYFEDLIEDLPGIDTHGLLHGAADPLEGPSIRFEPEGDYIQ